MIVQAPLALRYALRELRAGTRGLRIVLACLALGVAVIAGVGSLRAGLARGLRENGAVLMGGDLVIDGGATPLPAALDAWLTARGAGINHVVSLRSMLAAPNGERQLIELKATDAAWPLLGEARFAPPMPVARALRGIAADPVVLDRLRLHPGDTVKLGTAMLTLTAALAEEPDRLSTESLAPHAVIALATLDQAGLLLPGAIVSYGLRLKLPAGTSAEATEAALRRDFPGTGWRIHDRVQGMAGLDRALDQLTEFLTLVGLTSLLVGGIGVATGVRAWLLARARSLATLRCLGAPGGMMLAMSLTQIMVLSLAGIVLGIGVGAALPWVLIRVIDAALPLPITLALYPRPLALAALYGLLTAGCFALWPVWRATRIRGAALFRDAVIPEPVRPSAAILAANAVLAALLVALTWASSPDPRLALGFCAAAGGSLLLFRLGAALLARAARSGRHLRAPILRLGLANLHRPGAPTGLMLVSVGLGLSTLAAVALIQGNMSRDITRNLPARAPSLFFIDLQNDQIAPFRQIAAAVPGVTDVREVPSLRARIVSVNGVPAEAVRASPETQWALRGDRGLSYAATIPPGSSLVAGQWWPADYDGPPLVSFDATIAAGWGVHVGDSIQVNVLGRDIDLRVASLRRIDWGSLGINFTLVASPGLLSRAPHTHIATVRADPAATATLLRQVTDALPNVTGIPVAEVLGVIAAMLDRISLALAATGGLALLSGTLVLAGAVAAGSERRAREAVILKAVGVARRQIRAAWMVEFGALGLAAGLGAAVIGNAGSWAVMHYVLHAPWVFLPWHLAAVLVICLALMLGFGLIGTETALAAPAAPRLRNE